LELQTNLNVPPLETQKNLNNPLLGSQTNSNDPLMRSQMNSNDPHLRSRSSLGILHDVTLNNLKSQSEVMIFFGPLEQCRFGLKP